MDKVELSSAHFGRKAVFAILFLTIAVTAFVIGFTQLLEVEGGWQEIRATSGGSTSCAGEFVFYYELGAGGKSASGERREVTGAYSSAAVTAFQLFDNTDAYEDVHNVGYLNRHPNETVEVDPGLYRALEQVQASGYRALYLGPVYEIYNSIFFCENDTQAAYYDPLQDDPLRMYFARCAAYSRDPEAVDVKLLGDYQVQLAVSEAYLAFAREQEIKSFIDFGWMKNAFLADFLAEALTEQGFTHGTLTSYDGFVRNLDDRGETFTFNLFERGVQAGSFTYGGPMSIVYLRDYPMNSQDAQRYYVMEDGSIRSAYVDTADGLSRAAESDLAAYTENGDCAGVLLRIAPLYVSDKLNEKELSQLQAEGIFTILCRDDEICLNDPDLEVTASEGCKVIRQ